MLGLRLCAGKVLLRLAILVLMVVGLVAQAGLGEIGQWRIRLHPVERAAHTQSERELGDFAAFIEAHVPRGEAILYVTPDTGNGERWPYFKANYLLYPSRVWWVVPSAESNPPYPWIRSPLTGEALNDLAKSKDARYIVIDGISVPEHLEYSSIFVFQPGRAVLGLPRQG